MIASGSLKIVPIGMISQFPEQMVINAVYLALSCESIVNWTMITKNNNHRDAINEFNDLVHANGEMTILRIILAMNTRFTRVDSIDVCFTGLMHVLGFPFSHLGYINIRDRSCKKCNLHDVCPFRYCRVDPNILVVKSITMFCKQCGTNVGRIRDNSDFRIMIVDYIAPNGDRNTRNNEWHVTGIVVSVSNSDLVKTLVPEGIHWMDSNLHVIMPHNKNGLNDFINVNHSTFGVMCRE